MGDVDKELLHGGIFVDIIDDDGLDQKLQPVQAQTAGGVKVPSDLVADTGHVHLADLVNRILSLVSL